VLKTRILKVPHDYEALHNGDLDVNLDFTKEKNRLAALTRPSVVCGKGLNNLENC